MPEPLVFVVGGYALAMLPTPAECPRCHRAVQFVINRHGRTLCVACDSEETPSHADDPSRSSAGLLREAERLVLALDAHECEMCRPHPVRPGYFSAVAPLEYKPMCRRVSP